MTSSLPQGSGSAAQNVPGPFSPEGAPPGGSDAADGDELDPELVALPAPPQRGRTFAMGVLVLASLAALAMVLALRGDIAYAFRSSIPAELGDLRTANETTLSSLENRYVRAEGHLGAAGGIRYERPFVDGTFRTLPVAGRHDLWVDVRVRPPAETAAAAGAGEDGGRWEPPSTFMGRLVRLGSAGPRHRGLAGAIEEATRDGAVARAWLLIDGEQPESSRWSVVLAALFLGFAGWNFAAAARIVRRLR